MNKSSLPLAALAISAATLSIIVPANYALAENIVASETGSDARNVISDAAITTAIKGRYMADKDIKAFNIHVETINGTVTLTGNVPSTKAADDAIRIAKSTDGVKSVISKLRIK